MQSEILRSMDLERYLLLAAAVMGSDTCVWIADADDHLMAGALPWQPERVPVRHSFDIRDHLKVLLARVWVACPDAPSLVQAQASMPLVIDALVTELRLSADLEALTDELTDRYEDLNLVFDNQEVATGLVDLRTALTALADNAAAHLQEGLVLMLFPERDIEIVREQNPGEDCDSAGLRALARGALWSFMRRQTHTLVFNRDSETSELELCSEFGVKTLMAPILLGGQETVGYLLLAKPEHSANFSNGDRRIAEVICQNAQSVLAAHFDGLTGLLQRGAFESQLAETIAQDRHRAQPHVLLHLSVDRTQVVNDAFGRAAGDVLLKQVAKAIDRNVRRADFVARLGGDEFAVLLRDIELPAAQRVAELISTATRSIVLGVAEGEPAVSVSIGVCPVDTSASPEAALSQAQIACDKAREGGGGKVHLFDNENELMAARHAQSQLVTTIQAALAGDQFSLFCQPIVALAPETHGRHFEVLLRMHDSAGAMVSPTAFLPIAERYSLLPQIDRWVIRMALKALDHSSFLMVEPDAVCAINLSGQSLSDDQFLDFVLDAVADTTVLPRNLCFEITETAAINDLTTAQLFIGELKARGFAFSLDDFGTGLSSFTYLQQMPVDYLKIDGSFVSKITSDPISRAMVKAIADVAQAMQVRTVGEFVEDEAIRAELADLGITYGQGYLFSKPVPMQEYFDACVHATDRESAQ